MFFHASDSTATLFLWSSHCWCHVNSLVCPCLDKPQSYPKTIIERNDTLYIMFWVCIWVDSVFFIGGADEALKTILDPAELILKRSIPSSSFIFSDSSSLLCLFWQPHLPLRQILCCRTSDCRVTWKKKKDANLVLTSKSHTKTFLHLLYHNIKCQ